MFRSSFTRAAALAAVLGTLATASYAAPSDPSMAAAPANGSAMQATKASSHHAMKPPTAEEMKAHVEERIATLHSKLMITPDQESAWGDVAQAMRDNETNMSGLMQDRHNASDTSRTAVDDLASYQKIAQAHADGLAKVTSAFSTLYDSMSDDQKKNADKVFGSYEGRDGMSHGHHGTAMKKTAPTTSSQ